MVEASPPSCDGRRVLFEIVENDVAVACAISLNALQDLSAHRCFKPAELLACFAQRRRQIEKIARTKARARSEDEGGLIYVWSDDIDEAPAAQPASAAQPAKVA